jgi:hypothetical protein
VKVEPRQRRYTVGVGAVKVEITDCGAIALEPDEQVTFTTPQGGEYDVTRKSWGFFATPSLNGRLARFNLRPVLVKGADQYFILLVEKGCEALFYEYIGQHPYTIVLWLDGDLAAAISRDA